MEERELIDQVKRLLQRTPVYRPLQRTWHLVRQPQQVVNSLIAGLAARLPPRGPGSLSYRLVDWFYTGDGKLAAIRSAVATGSKTINGLTAPPPEAPAAPKALVVTLRTSYAWPHALHGYMVGCALRELGYRVGFVVCSGAVEHCGMVQEFCGSLVPPYACSGCRNATRALALDGFDLHDLNDYRSAEEEEEVKAFTEQEDGAADYLLDGVPLLECIRPYLLRYYQGDYRKIAFGDQATREHCKAGIRYYHRFRRLLDTVQPSSLCLFNGLFFPEDLFFAQARARGTRCLFTERGLNKNTIFVSSDEPACHYQSNRLWESVRDRITEAQVKIAAEYLARRLSDPRDPSGERRDILDRDEQKYQRLAGDPYVVFFAPVTHDTASMEKDDPAGGFFPALTRLCSLAKQLRKRLIVRSHPDELLAVNPSRYTIRQFLADQRLLDDCYVGCLDSTERWNPYLLAKHARGIVVYNGNLGIELPGLGYRVFNLARSHYSNKGFTTDLHSLEEFRAIFESEEKTATPWQRELALKYLYQHIYLASIPVDSFLDEHRRFEFSLVEDASQGKQRAQLDRIKERVAFLIGAPARPAPASAGMESVTP